MNSEIDGLKEVCESVQIVQQGEQEIVAIETQIANRMREIAKKIFSGETKYRMKKQKIDFEDGTLTYWAFGVMLQDNIKFDGNFWGSAQTMRIDQKGNIMTIWQYVPRCSAYDLMEDHMIYDMNSANPRPSSDHEIAANAPELAKGLLDALRTRIDTMKGEKASLQKVAQAIL